MTLWMSEQWRTRRVPARSGSRSIHRPTLTVKIIVMVVACAEVGQGATTRLHDSRDLYCSLGKIALFYISALPCGTLDAASFQNAP